MQRGLPSAQFRLRKGHLFYLLDLAIAATRIDYAVGRDLTRS